MSQIADRVADMDRARAERPPMSPEDRHYLWTRFKIHAPSADPGRLRWDAQDYRDAADLSVDMSDDVRALLRGCASDMEAAAMFIESHR